MNPQPDVLIYNTIGPPFTGRSVKRHPPGGSELEVTQIAGALAKRGHRVVVANAVREVVEDDDSVLYVPAHRAVDFWPAKALVVMRYSRCAPILTSPAPLRVVVRATDLACPEYDAYRSLLKRGDAALVAVSKWQADAFPFAKERIVINPILEDLGSESVAKMPGRFVFASGPIKGLEPTILLWTKMRERYAEMRDAELVLMSPGWGEWPIPPGYHDPERGIRYIGAPPPQEYRRIIASAEGLFFVNTHTETFCCLAAFADQWAVRPHILLQAGEGGIREASPSPYITEDEEAFEKMVVESRGKLAFGATYRIRSPEVLVHAWEQALHLTP